MTAYSITLRDLANALLLRPRQKVHVCERKFRNGEQVWPVKVLVIPAGKTTGEYYAIYREQTIDALKDGVIDCEDLEIWESEPCSEF